MKAGKTYFSVQLAVAIIAVVAIFGFILVRGATVETIGVAFAILAVVALAAFLQLRPRNRE